jgi:para-aminobenzoate synthetase/4-amino-4-deoxychorismate lyase
VTISNAQQLDSPRPDPSAGVFETMLVLDGLPLELEAHLERLGASLEALFQQALPADARDLVLAAARDTRVGRLRLDVSPAEGNGVRVADVDEAIVFPAFENGVELVAFAVPGGIGAHKWADRRLLERAERDAGGAVPLILDADGTLLETSRGSLFLVRDGVVSTPSADGRLLPGVTRARVIELAGAAGIEVREEELPLERLLAADEAFTTGAVRGVEPVRAARGLCEWEAGELTARVAAELRGLWFG